MEIPIGEKTMKVTVGLVLSIVTLVGTLLIGGANFGELRSATKNNAMAIQEYRYDLEKQFTQIRMENDVRAVELRKESMENMRVVAKMSADIEWIKDNIRRN